MEKIKEWAKQRRVWACVLSALAAGLAASGQTQWVAVITSVAGALALHSYVKPK